MGLKIFRSLTYSQKYSNLKMRFTELMEKAFENKDLESALIVADEILRIDIKNEYVWYFKALVLKEMKRYKTAELVCLKAINFSSNLKLKFLLVKLFKIQLKLSTAINYLNTISYGDYKYIDVKKAELKKIKIYLWQKNYLTAFKLLQGSLGDFTFFVNRKQDIKNFEQYLIGFLEDNHKSDLVEISEIDINEKKENAKTYIFPKEILSNGIRILFFPDKNQNNLTKKDFVDQDILIKIIQKLLYNYLFIFLEYNHSKIVIQEVMHYMKIFDWKPYYFYDLIAVLHIKIENFNRGILAVNKSLEINDKKYINNLKWAQILFHDGEYNKALTILDFLNKKYFYLYEAYILKGDIYVQQRDMKGADESYQKAKLYVLEYDETANFVINKRIEESVKFERRSIKSGEKSEKDVEIKPKNKKNKEYNLDEKCLQYFTILSAKSDNFFQQELDIKDKDFEGNYPKEELEKIHKKGFFSSIFKGIKLGRKNKEENEYNGYFTYLNKNKHYLKKLFSHKYYCQTYRKAGELYLGYNQKKTNSYIYKREDILQKMTDFFSFYDKQKDVNASILILSGFGDKNGFLIGENSKINTYLQYNDISKLWKERKNRKTNKFLLLILDFNHSGSWALECKENLDFIDSTGIFVYSSCSLEKLNPILYRKGSALIYNLTKINTLENMNYNIYDITETLYQGYESHILKSFLKEEIHNFTNMKINRKKGIFFKKDIYDDFDELCLGGFIQIENYENSYDLLDERHLDKFESDSCLSCEMEINDEINFTGNKKKHRKNQNVDLIFEKIDNFLKNGTFAVDIAEKLFKRLIRKGTINNWNLKRKTSKKFGRGFFEFFSKGITGFIDKKYEGNNLINNNIDNENNKIMKKFDPITADLKNIDVNKKNINENIKEFNEFEILYEEKEDKENEEEDIRFKIKEKSNDFDKSENSENLIKLENSIKKYDDDLIYDENLEDIDNLAKEFEFYDNLNKIEVRTSFSQKIKNEDEENKNWENLDLFSLQIKPKKKKDKKKNNRKFNINSEIIEGESVKKPIILNEIIENNSDHDIKSINIEKNYSNILIDRMKNNLANISEISIKENRSNKQSTYFSKNKMNENVSLFSNNNDFKSKEGISKIFNFSGNGDISSKKLKIISPENKKDEDIKSSRDFISFEKYEKIEKNTNTKDEILKEENNFTIDINENTNLVQKKNISIINVISDKDKDGINSNGLLGLIPMNEEKQQVKKKKKYKNIFQKIINSKKNQGESSKNNNNVSNADFKSEILIDKISKNKLENNKNIELSSKINKKDESDILLDKKSSIRESLESNRITRNDTRNVIKTNEILVKINYTYKRIDDENINNQCKIRNYLFNVFNFDLKDFIDVEYLKSGENKMNYKDLLMRFDNKVHDQKFLANLGIIHMENKSFFHPRLIGNFFFIEKLFGLKLPQRDYKNLIKFKFTKNFYEDGIYIGQYKNSQKTNMTLKIYKDYLLRNLKKSEINEENLQKLINMIMKELNTIGTLDRKIIDNYTNFLLENDEYLHKLNEFKKLGVLRDGLGIFTSFSGDRYEGNFKRNIYHGFGKMNYSNGDEYCGFWRFGCKHGKGVYFYDNGDKYEGDFYYDKFQGNGKLIYIDKKEYKGMFKNNQFDSKGVFIDKRKNSKLTGVWSEGVLQKGILILYDKKENIILSSYGVVDNSINQVSYIGFRLLIDKQKKSINILKQFKPGIENIQKNQQINNEFDDDLVYFGFMKPESDKFFKTEGFLFHFFKISEKIISKFQYYGGHYNFKKNGLGVLVEYLSYEGDKTIIDSLNKDNLIDMVKNLKQYNFNAEEIIKNANVYIGNFENNLKNDEKAEYIFNRGKLLFSGEFQKNLMKKGKIYSNGKILFEGTFEEDCIPSTGILFDERGNRIYKGMFKRGLPHGEGITSKGKFIFDNGEINSEYFSNEILNTKAHVESIKIAKENIMTINQRLNLIYDCSLKENDNEHKSVSKKITQILEIWRLDKKLFEILEEYDNFSNNNKRIDNN